MYVSETRVGWRFTDVLSSALRVLALLVLAVGLASAIVAEHPVRRPTEFLTADIASGQVTYLEYEARLDRIRWSTGVWEWWETSPPYDFFTDTELPRSQLVERWLQDHIAVSGHPLIVRTVNQPASRWWVGQVKWQPAQLPAGVVWLGTFFLMLITREHRYANRWAWFWLFTVGQVGALLYLLFEPRPVWRPASAATPAGHAPRTGGQGCAWSILLAFVAPMLGLAFSLAINRLLAK